MVGEIAEGGGDFRIVSVLPFVVTVLSVIDSVRITSSCENAGRDRNKTTNAAIRKDITHTPMLKLKASFKIKNVNNYCRM